MRQIHEVDWHRHPLILTPQQVQRITGLTSYDLRGMEQAGVVKPLKLTGKYRKWRRNDIAAIFERQQRDG